MNKIFFILAAKLFETERLTTAFSMPSLNLRIQKAAKLRILRFNKLFNFHLHNYLEILISVKLL